MNTTLKNAFEFFGPYRLARICKVSGPAVYKWKKRGCLPRTEWTGETCYAELIEKASGGHFAKDELLGKMPALWEQILVFDNPWPDETQCLFCIDAGFDGLGNRTFLWPGWRTKPDRAWIACSGVMKVSACLSPENDGRGVYQVNLSSGLPDMDVWDRDGSLFVVNAKG